MILKPTTQLISETPQVRTFADVLAHSSGSAAGFSVNSEFLSCPEKSRLKHAGIRFKGYKAKGSAIDPEFELSALEFGTLIHELARFRVWYGPDAAMQLLEIWRPELGASHVKAALMLATYEQTFPYATEPLRFLGVECEVVTNIRMGDRDPRPCFRSVRYDGIVLAGIGEVRELYSLERKTMSRGGPSALHAYYSQGMVQVAMWNSNAELVAQYGKMRGVIYEPWLKTKNPTCDRVPVYFSPEQETLARDYMRLAENGGVSFRQKEDGTYPKMLHSCWGRYSPCDYISLCHEGVTGDYTINGEELR
ncbi:MAG: hypothetical protein WAV09_03500 [Minisyncoccia bacterium]